MEGGGWRVEGGGGWIGGLDLVLSVLENSLEVVGQLAARVQLRACAPLALTTLS